MQEVFISIHSLRVEGDQLPPFKRGFFLYFNPLPPCGGRPKSMLSSLVMTVISIHSLRVEGDDKQIRDITTTITISIHSLRVEGDCPVSSSFLLMLHFNPLPPCGGRHYNVKTSKVSPNISIHSLRVEGDFLQACKL